MKARETSWVQAAGILVHREQPVALVRTETGAELVASWPDLELGHRAVTSDVRLAPDGAWVVYRPQESEDPDFPPGCEAAVYVGADGACTRVERMPDRHPAGATRHGLWVADADFFDPDDEAAWTAPQRLLLFAPDGSRREIEVDRLALAAIDDGGRARILFYASAPTAHREHGGTSYEYHYDLVELPGGLLPDRMRVGALSPRRLSDEAMIELLTAFSPVAPDREPAVPGIRWSLVDLSAEERDAAIQSVLREFAHLDAYWSDDSGRASPLAEGLADPRVEAVGAWPDTVVEVSLRHPHYPAGRLRRRIPVFDSAGRARPALYASIHLMEDLDTGHLPDPSAARDGILDI